MDNTLRDHGQEMIQMYQAGFLDGYATARGIHTKRDLVRLWKKIYGACKTRFEMRFMKGITSSMKAVKK